MNKDKGRAEAVRTLALLMLLLGAALGHNSRPSGHPSPPPPLRGEENYASCDGSRRQLPQTLLGGWGHSEGREGDGRSAGGGSRAEIERTLVQRSFQDESSGRGCLMTQGYRGAGAGDAAARGR